MVRFSAIAGLQCSLVTLMVSSAVIAVWAPAPSSLQASQRDEIAAPPDKSTMEKFMAQKLAAAQRTLEGVTKEDFELIRKMSVEMIALSRQEAWAAMASARFVQDTADFVTAVEFLDRMAEDKDPEGTSLGFMRLTMTCTNCHAHVRTARVADRRPQLNHVSDVAQNDSIQHALHN
jgi:hypothetical protein